MGPDVVWKQCEAKGRGTTNAGEALFRLLLPMWRQSQPPTGRRLLLHPVLPTCFPSLYPPAVRLLCPVWHTAAHPLPTYEDSSATSVSWKNPSICSEQLETEVRSVGNRRDARCERAFGILILKSRRLLRSSRDPVPPDSHLEKGAMPVRSPCAFSDQQRKGDFLGHLKSVPTVGSS